MSGDKLENVKKAMEFVVGQLRKEDWLSMVQYDRSVSVLKLRPKCLTNRPLDVHSSKSGFRYFNEVV